MLATPSSALDPNFTVRVAKHKDGPYKEVLSANVGKNDTKRLWYRVRSNSEDRQEGLLFDNDNQEPPEDLRVKWFLGKKNVTFEVELVGYGFNLNPGASKYFQARVKAVEANVEHCLIGRVVDPSTVTQAEAYAGINDDCVL